VLFVRAVVRIDSNGVLIATFSPRPSAAGKIFRVSLTFSIFWRTVNLLFPSQFESHRDRKLSSCMFLFSTQKNRQLIFAGSLAALIPVEFFPIFFEDPIFSRELNDGGSDWDSSLLDPSPRSPPRERRILSPDADLNTD